MIELKLRHMTAALDYLQGRHFRDAYVCTVYVTKLSKKRNVLSLSTAFIFSKLNMCKYLYDHNNIHQLRHKLNKFHRHVTNRNGIGGDQNKK